MDRQPHISLSKDTSGIQGTCAPGATRIPTPASTRIRMSVPDMKLLRFTITTTGGVRITIRREFDSGSGARSGGGKYDTKICIVRTEQEDFSK